MRTFGIMFGVHKQHLVGTLFSIIVLLNLSTCVQCVNDTHICLACPIGSFKSNETLCTQCPAGYTTTHEASTRADSCFLPGPDMNTTTNITEETPSTTTPRDESTAEITYGEEISTTTDVVEATTTLRDESTAEITYGEEISTTTDVVDDTTSTTLPEYENTTTTTTPPSEGNDTSPNISTTAVNTTPDIDTTTTKITFTLSLSLSMAEFNSQVRTQYIDSVATSLDVDRTYVNIESYGIAQTSGRRLLVNQLDVTTSLRVEPNRVESLLISYNSNTIETALETHDIVVVARSVPLVTTPMNSLPLTTPVPINTPLNNTSSSMIWDNMSDSQLIMVVIAVASTCICCTCVTVFCWVRKKKNHINRNGHDRRVRFHIPRRQRYPQSSITSSGDIFDNIKIDLGFIA
jgi:hypothetical protein